MSAVLQLLGAVAIGLGLVGTWLAGRRRTGWLVCIISSALWLPTLVTADQWAAVVNCGLSMGICLRNFGARVGRRGRTSAADVVAQERRAHLERRLVAQVAAG